MTSMQAGPSTEPRAVSSVLQAGLEIEEEEGTEGRDEPVVESIHGTVPTSEPVTTSKGKRVARADESTISMLDDKAIELLAYLDEVNGQDAYSNEDAALGKVSTKEYLILPLGMTVPGIAASEVGSAKVHELFSKEQLAQVYALNKANAPSESSAVKYALIRMEAVKMGWVAGQREITWTTPPSDAMATFIKDLTEERGNIGRYRQAAFLIPLVAEHTFRTMGHHYLTGEQATYEGRYQSTLRACLADNVHGMLPGGIQYHSLLHWVSPARAREVLMAQIGNTRIPEALALRASAAPAGTALITTTAAVLSAMRAANIYDDLKTHGGFALDTLESVTTKVKANPTKYHKTHYAYRVAAPTTAELKQVEDAKVIAARFAPIAQAFIDAMFQDSQLGRAKALRKHADDNPVLMKKANRFFRNLGKVKADSIADLFTKTATD